MIRLILAGERPQSWNKHWAGTHWTKRKKERDRVHMLVRSEIDPDNAVIFNSPVEITINVWFKSRPLDVFNIVTKPYVDALIGWYIVDDSPDHVPVTHTGSFIDKRRPRMEIEIKPVSGAPF